MYGINAGRATSQSWLGMGGQGIGVRGVLGPIPWGTTPFDSVTFKWDRLEREDREKLLGFTVSQKLSKIGRTTCSNVIEYGMDLLNWKVNCINTKELIL